MDKKYNQNTKMFKSDKINKFSKEFALNLDKNHQNFRKKFNIPLKKNLPNSKLNFDLISVIYG